MKNIYEIYIPVTSQEQSDRLKAICLKYKLPIWNFSFKLNEYISGEIFCYMKNDSEFFILSHPENIMEAKKIQTESTESEFIALLENNTEK